MEYMNNIMSSKSKLFYTTQKGYRISQLSELCPTANSNEAGPLII